ncbi:MAG TPA: hypothetical protein VG939_08280 [Caulobacteraceae bacterium]|nr:hypothetical protein [Caulobacteraceae bacterium]
MRLQVIAAAIGLVLTFGANPQAAEREYQVGDGRPGRFRAAAGGVKEPATPARAQLSVELVQ